jgi:glucose/arabinose dehydrogenase
MSVRAVSSLVCCSSVLLAVACGDGGKADPRVPADPHPSGGGEGSGGEPGIPTDPASLRVEFEELSLETEPTFITDFVFYPGSDTDFLALDKSGQLLRFEMSENSAKLVSAVQVAGVYDSLDCGALSLAFEPDFDEGKYVYVGTCVSLTHSEIFRLDLDDDSNPVAGSEASIISVGYAGATRPWHNIGSIGFEPGGVLWALFGDKVQGAPAQDEASPLGKLLRIVPSREPGLGGYEPAPDGPRAEASDAEPSMWALGLRSPFRGTRDSRGFYWIGDVGSDVFEEVNVVRNPLDNLGWPTFEGPCDDCGDTLPPTFSWPRDEVPEYVFDDLETESTLARVAWAGPEVVASENERYNGRLAGSVLFGDFCAGFLRHGRVDDDGVPTLDAPLGHLNNAGAFRQHTDGYVYAITFGQCQTDVMNKADEPFSRLYRMVPSD